MELVREALTSASPFELTPALLCELNHLAVDGLIDHPGALREIDLTISGSMHVPPPWQEVKGHVDQLCDTVNQGGRDAVELAAFVLWRVNWIHPFEDGNGRTARAAAYLALSVAIGRELPGEITLIELLVKQKRDYWKALSHADRAWLKGRENVSMMTRLLDVLLQRQIADE